MTPMSNSGLHLTNAGAARTVLRPVRLLSPFAAETRVGRSSSRALASHS